MLVRVQYMYALVQSTCSVEGGLDPVDQSLLQRLFGWVGALLCAEEYRGLTTESILSGKTCLLCTEKKLLEAGPDP